MTLSEIEIILGELAMRHHDLDATLLATLLQSAGWDNATIKEALVIFEQKNTIKNKNISSIANEQTQVLPQASIQKSLSVKPIRNEESLQGPRTIPSAPVLVKPAKGISPPTQGSSPSVIGAFFRVFFGGYGAPLPHKEVGMIIPAPVVIKDKPAARQTPYQAPVHNEQEIIPLPQKEALIISPSIKPPYETQKEESALLIPPKTETFDDHTMASVAANSTPVIVPNKEEVVTFYNHDGNEEEFPFEDTTSHTPRDTTQSVKPSFVINLLNFFTHHQRPVEKNVQTLAPAPRGEEQEKEVTNEIKIEQKQITPNIIQATPINDTSRSVSNPSKDLSKNNPSSLLMSVAPDISNTITAEKESLIIHHEEKNVVAKKDTELPHNLPLLPFESSSHVWSFSNYKNTFHADTVLEKENNIPPIVLKEKKPDYLPYRVEDDEEINVEKIPLTKGDESLVFLAGVMLLVIILILGYMYSNGRL